MRKLNVLPKVLLLCGALLTWGIVTAQVQMANTATALIQKNQQALGFSGKDVEETKIANAYYDELSQLTLVYAQQTVLGIPIYNQVQTLGFRNGSLVSVTGKRLAKADTKINQLNDQPGISAVAAIQAVAAHLGITITETPQSLREDANGRLVYSPLTISKDSIRVQLLWTPVGNKLVLSWQVEIAPKNTNDLWLVRIHAQDGSVLGKDNLTVYCAIPNCHDTHHEQHATASIEKMGSGVSVNAVNTATYRVSPYPAESPIHAGGAFALRTDPWLLAPNTNATTYKWHKDNPASTNDYIITRGNNVYALEDANNLNAGGISDTSTTPEPSLTFTRVYNSNVGASVGDNQKAAITNLFYWNNIIHDLTYQYGFNEVSGNFQNYNFDRGGLGNDYVIADAQDGGGTNNANFSSPADGTRPRMQMYLWTGSPYEVCKVNAPASLAGGKYALEGAVSTQNKLAKKTAITALLAVYKDASPTTSLACSAASNPTELAGRIALIDRGSCNYQVKIKNAQNAGAVGVIMINNVTGNPIQMGGNDNTITIPAVMVSLTDGAALKLAVQGGQEVSVTLKDASLDGDFDNGIITHEYTHGISNRLTGGPANAACLQNAEQMGEGWSDYFALMLTTNWATANTTDGPLPRAIGNYAVGNTAAGSGIRTYPYSTNMNVNPWNYGMLATNTFGGESHYVGEIWCAVLWDMTWKMIETEGINTNFYNAAGMGGNSDAFKLVMTGMKLQPCSPGFLDGRDAILKADTLLFNGKYSCAIWTAFARRGMGVNAVQGSSFSVSDQAAGYLLPQYASVKKTVNYAQAAMNQELTYSLKVTAQCYGVTSYKLVDTLSANLTYVTGSGGVYDATYRTVTFSNINLGPSASQTFTFRAKINTGTYTAPVQHIDQKVTTASIPTGWLASSNVTTQWTVSSVTSKSTPYAFFAQELPTPSELTLRTTGTYTLSKISTLNFWHNYNTEAGFDGCVVEMSTDLGLTWLDLGPYMVINGYNSTISPDAATSIINKKAFSGTSNGFVNTIANLTSFAGATVMFRFRLITDNGTANTGWYVDDISVRSEAGVYNKVNLFDASTTLRATSDTLTIIQNLVPVVWKSFTAVKQNNKALLTWVTAQEVNNAYYEIERSTDGTSFIALQKVNATSGNTQQTYTAIDEQPAKGINYYRIKQVDKDGAYSYSEIRVLVFDNSKNNVYVYPNPAKDKVTILIEGNKKMVQAQLLNSIGQVVQNITLSAEVNQVNISSLTPGLYYIKLITTSGQHIQKLMVE